MTLGPAALDLSEIYGLLGFRAAVMRITESYGESTPLGFGVLI